MKKGLIIIRNIIVGIIFALYLTVIIGVSTLILTRNDYGVTQLGEKALIIIDRTNANDRYKAGQLVVVESRKFEDLKVGQEVFVYQTDMQEKKVTVIPSSIKEINNEEQNKHIVLQVDGTAWGNEFIAGEAISVHDNVGKVFQFLQSKWIFFILFIVPLFFVLLYLIYKIVVVIKFESDGLTEEEMALLAKKDEQEKEVVVPTDDDKITALMNEIAALKEKIDNTEEQKATGVVNPVVADKPEESLEVMVENNDSFPVVENATCTQTVELPKIEAVDHDYAEVPVMASMSAAESSMAKSDDSGSAASIPPIIHEVSIAETEEKNSDVVIQTEKVNVAGQDIKPLAIDSNDADEIINEEKTHVEIKPQIQEEAEEELI